MEFLLLFNETRGTPPPEAGGMAEMTKYSNELAAQGKLRRGGPLAPGVDGACVRVRDGKEFVTDGPFPESKELVAGFWIVEAADRAEAIAIAKRCPHLRRGPVELHAFGGRYSFPDSEKGAPYLLVFRLEPGFVHEPAKGREMMAYGETLVRDGVQFETGHLANTPPPARLETKAGKVFVTDGPFAETKDLIGGYSLVRVDGRAGAIEIAVRFPHSRWGPVEVREVLFFDPV